MKIKLMARHRKGSGHENNHSWWANLGAGPPDSIEDGTQVDAIVLPKLENEKAAQVIIYDPDTEEVEISELVPNDYIVLTGPGLAVTHAQRYPKKGTTILTLKRVG